MGGGVDISDMGGANTYFIPLPVTTLKSWQLAITKHFTTNFIAAMELGVDESSHPREFLSKAASNLCRGDYWPLSTIWLMICHRDNSALLILSRLSIIVRCR
jgi:hypothetical protein